jgi:hypothetical protein
LDRIAVLINPADATMMETQLRDVNTAARTMTLHIQTLNADTTDEIDAAFKTLGRERPRTLLFLAVRSNGIAGRYRRDA